MTLGVHQETPGDSRVPAGRALRQESEWDCDNDVGLQVAYMVAVVRELRPTKFAEKKGSRIRRLALG